MNDWHFFNPKRHATACGINLRTHDGPLNVTTRIGVTCGECLKSDAYRNAHLVGRAHAPYPPPETPTEPASAKTGAP